MSSISVGKSYQPNLVNYSAKTNQNDTNATIPQMAKKEDKMSTTTKCVVGGIVIASMALA